MHLGQRPGRAAGSLSRQRDDASQRFADSVQTWWLVDDLEARHVRTLGVERASAGGREHKD